MWIGSFLALLGIFLIIPLIVVLGMYILLSMGLYEMALNANIENPWLAWIPFGNLYILGKLIPKLSIMGYVIPSHELVLPIIAILSAFCGGIPLLGALIMLANLILLISAVYLLFLKYALDNALIYTIVGFVTCGIMIAVFIFMLRKERPLT